MSVDDGKSVSRLLYAQNGFPSFFLLLLCVVLRLILVALFVVQDFGSLFDMGDTERAFLQECRRQGW